MFIQGQDDMKQRSGARLRICKYQPAMITNNFFTEWQTNSGSGVFVPLVQTLEDLKYFVFKLHIETNSIIGKMNLKIFLIGIKVREFKHFYSCKISGSDIDYRRRSFINEF